MKIQDKVVVVTGGASGIGRGLCRRFAVEGAKGIVVSDIDGEGAAKVAKEIGGLAATADVGKEADIQSLVRIATRHYGPIDLFCSNAGISARGGAEAPDSVWQRCSDMALLGYKFPGAMAEYVHVPFAALGRTVFPLPTELTYEDGASVEPVSISYFSVNRAQPRENETIAVLGLGVIGLFAIQVLKTLGIAKIVASGRRPARLGAAKVCGADIVIDAAKEDAVGAAMAATDKMGVNTVIECAGMQATFDQSIAMARGGGKIVLVGVYEQPLTWNPLPVISKNLSLIGCLGGNFPACIELLRNAKVSAKPMITHRFSLDQAAEAFRTQLQDPRAIKVLIVP